MTNDPLPIKFNNQYTSLDYGKVSENMLQK